MDLGKSSWYKNWHTYMCREVYIDKSRVRNKGTHDRWSMWSRGVIWQVTDKGELTMKGMQGGERSTKYYQALLSTPKGPSFRNGTRGSGLSSGNRSWQFLSLYLLWELRYLCCHKGKLNSTNVWYSVWWCTGKVKLGNRWGDSHTLTIVGLHMWPTGCMYLWCDLLIATRQCG
jgi:hypothetical protein